MHQPLFLLGVPNMGELLLILFVIIIFFGAKRIPEMFKGIGQGVREFKDATKGDDNQQPQYRDQPMAPPTQPPYQQQYPQQGHPQQGYPQQPPYPQQQYPQQGYPQTGAPQQPTPPAYNPNDPNTLPKQ